MSMRIVIKPAGAVLIMVLLGVVAFLVTRGKPAEGTAAPSLPVAVGAEPLLVAPSVSASPASHWRFVGAKSVPVASTNGEVIRAELSPQLPAKPWSNMLVQDIAVPLKKGDRLVFHGFVRSSSPRAVSVFAEESESPHGKTLTCETSVADEWSELNAQGVTKRDFSAGEARMVVHMGGESGFVEIKGFTLSRAPGAPETP